ncbi:hypothetical protein ACWDYH_25075 [Nocardia goodfellowii]
MTRPEVELSATRMLSELTALVRLRPPNPPPQQEAPPDGVIRMTPPRISVLRLSLEFPCVAPEVIKAIVARSNADLRPSLSESLTEMTELLARQRLRRIAGSGAVDSA